MTRRFWIPIWIAISISSLHFGHVRECKAQLTLGTAEYDYHALALTAISNSAREASKLTDISSFAPSAKASARQRAPRPRVDAQ